MLSLCIYLTVAILAQGTHWAVAVTQAFFHVGSKPRCALAMHMEAEEGMEEKERHR